MNILTDYIKARADRYTHVVQVGRRFSPESLDEKSQWEHGAQQLLCECAAEQQWSVMKDLIDLGLNQERVPSSTWRMWERVLRSFVRNENVEAMGQMCGCFFSSAHAPKTMKSFVRLLPLVYEWGLQTSIPVEVILQRALQHSSSAQWCLSVSKLLRWPSVKDNPSFFMLVQRMLPQSSTPMDLGGLVYSNIEDLKHPKVQALAHFLVSHTSFDHCMLSLGERNKTEAGQTGVSAEDLILGVVPPTKKNILVAQRQWNVLGMWQRVVEVGMFFEQQGGLVDFTRYPSLGVLRNAWPGAVTGQIVEDFDRLSLKATLCQHTEAQTPEFSKRKIL